jgi:hypothetical protein
MVMLPGVTFPFHMCEGNELLYLVVVIYCSTEFDHSFCYLLCVLFFGCRCDFALFST